MNRFSESKQSSSEVWIDPPKNLILGENQIHIWRSRVDFQGSFSEVFESVLSKEELERASRFHFDQDRAKFILRRAILRYLLASYHSCDPGGLEFYSNAFGKPYLSQKGMSKSITFNISQSGSWALFAFAQGFEIGIDVEAYRENIEYLRLAERFFSPHEILELKSIAKGLQLEAFFLCWTRKEAFIKGHGEGLSIPLDQFDVNMTPGIKAMLLKTNGNLEPAEEWTLLNIDVAPGYTGALAAHSENPTTAFFHYQFIDDLLEME